MSFITIGPDAPHGPYDAFRAPEERPPDSAHAAAPQRPLPGGPEVTGPDTCERLIEQLHAERYRDVLKYLVLHPLASGKLGAKAEHPARTYDLVGEGATWAEALAELLRLVDAEASDIWGRGDV